MEGQFLDSRRKSVEFLLQKNHAEENVYRKLMTRLEQIGDNLLHLQYIQAHTHTHNHTITQKISTARHAYSFGMILLRPYPLLTRSEAGSGELHTIRPMPVWKGPHQCSPVLEL